MSCPNRMGILQGGQPRATSPTGSHLHQTPPYSAKADLFGSLLSTAHDEVISFHQGDGISGCRGSKANVTRRAMPRLRCGDDIACDLVKPTPAFTLQPHAQGAAPLTDLSILERDGREEPLRFSVGRHIERDAKLLSVLRK